MVRIVACVFAEYRMIFDLAGYDRDLARLEAAYAPPRGAFWVLEEGGQVAGCVGATDEGEAGVELHRLYLDPRFRGRGHGRRLVRHVVEWARARGRERVYLWSDVRFAHAHALYRAEGFLPAGERTCADLEKSREYGFDLGLQSGVP